MCASFCYPHLWSIMMKIEIRYDIVGLDERSNEHCAGIEVSQARIESILEKEHNETGLPYSRYVLYGNRATLRYV